MMKQAGSSVLVVGATGTVGGSALRALVAQGAQVRALVRSRATARGLHASVDVREGDLRDAHAVESALRGARAALYVSPHEAEEERLAEIFVRACQATGTRLVFVGVHVDAPTRVGRAIRRFLFGRVLPHYVPKFRVAERARTSRADPIVLMPTNFFQNDELFREELLDGGFVQPFENPINRVDVRDLGDAAARACLDPTLPSGAYPLVGPESLDGHACARTWSATLTRSVTFDANDPRFPAAVTRELRAKKRDDFLASYAAIRKLSLPTTATDLARTTALLGRAPTSYAEYVRDTAAAWGAAERFDAVV